MLFTEVIAVYLKDHETDKYALWAKRRIIDC
jgi:hypothetical protein